MQPNEHYCGELLDHSLTKGVRCLAPKHFHYTKDGQIARNFDQAAITSTDHIYLSGSLVASRKTLHATGTTEVTYQHTDALGTPVAFTDAAGNLVRRERMTAWGEPADGTWSNGPGYTGHQMDAGSKLVYMQQRYYDPETGRFVSVDPVTANSVTGGNFNRYWYGNNNSYKFNDPDGRIAETVWDAANVAMGVASFAKNVAVGNYAGAAVDAVGVVVDVAATVTPVVPGGASTLIKSARTGDEVFQAVRASDRVSGVASGTGRAADRAALRDAGVPTSQSRADVKAPGGRPVPKAERQQLTRDSSGNPVVVSRHQPHPGGNQPHDSSPHSHAATPRIDEGGKISRRRDGTVRYHNQ